MRRTTFLTLLSALLLSPLAAQSQPEGWVLPFGLAYQPDVGDFNQVFRRHNLPEARTRHYGWGIEMRSLVNGFLVGPMFFRTWDDVHSDSFQLRTEATGIFGELGYKVAPSKFLTIVPMFGLGTLNQSFTFRQRTGAMPFDTLLERNNMTRVVSISHGMKFTGLAALELTLLASTKTGRYGLALRGGYLYSPLSLTWQQSNGSPVSGAPESRISGPFFSAGIVLMPEPETEASYP